MNENSMTKYDKLAWEIIKGKEQYPYSAAGIDKSGRPKNFNELESLVRNGTEFEPAFAMFLDEFYIHRSSEFFTEEPGEFFSSNYRAMLAATAEFLSIEFELPCPEWVSKKEYVLAQYWDPFVDYLADLVGPGDWGTDMNCVDPVFLRHRVIQKSKGLIRI